MKKLIIISQHLSTGGLPQYILKKLELLQDTYDLYVIECENFSDRYTVQRNKIKSILNDKLIHLYNESKSLYEIIQSIDPTYIWFEEIPEHFLNDDILDIIWNNKTYEIIESSHTSSDWSDKITHIPDKFILVSPYQKQFYEKFNIPITIIDYPVEQKERNKKEKQKELGLNQEVFHVVQIGLFSPHKNQSYTFELAKKLKDYHYIKFHFFGNMADNFKNYYEPLIKDKPYNCIIHGELSNIDDYIQAADLIIHPSTIELNPLVIKEALQYDDLPILISNIETHKQLYGLNDQVSFLNMNIDDDVCYIINNINIKKINKNYKFDKNYEPMNNNEFQNKIINTLEMNTEEMNTDYFKLDLNDGVRLTIDEKAPDINYKVEFIDNKSNAILYTTVIQKNMWTALNFKYYIDCFIIIRNYETKEVIKKLDTSLNGSNVKIILDSKALGDTLAWMSYAEEFRKKNNCNVYLLTFHNECFENQYPNINFITWNNINSIKSFATYRIGWYYDENFNINFNKNPNNFRLQPMQKTATDILGLEYEEIKPKLNFVKKSTKSKKVGIAIHGTSQVKYWNRENGWQEVVDFLNNNGYEVILYSKEHDGYMGNSNPTGVKQFPESDILTLASDLSECEFFIGIGSGLSWLAWVVETPVILISGFSANYTEFQTGVIRINNEIEECDKHCFNHNRMDPSDWNWCTCVPKYSCSFNIEPKQVIDAIKNNFITDTKEKLKLNISNQNVYVDKSPIHRMGVFANKDFDIDEIIEICPILELPFNKENIGDVLVDYRFNYPSGSGNYWKEQVVALGYGSLYNHKDDNNAHWYSEEIDNIKVFKFYAVKPIKKDEEIFVYYGDNTYWESRKHVHKL